MSSSVHRLRRPCRARRLAAGLALAGLAAVAVTPARAQVTETPQTVAPGRFLLEMDALSLAFDRHDAPAGATEYSLLGLATTFVTTGITRDLDAQIGFQFFLRQRFERLRLTERNSGIGDLFFRTKWTFWRDPASGQAAAVIPYVKVPTNSGGVGNDSIEGGVIVPWARSLGEGFEASAMVDWNVVRNDDDDGYDSHWFASACVARSFTSLLGFYAESTLHVTSASVSQAALTAGAGVLLHASKAVTWDYGVAVGLSRGASDWTHVVRVNWGF